MATSQRVSRGFHRLALFLAAIPLVGGATLAYGFSGTCSLVVNSHVYINGPCSIDYGSIGITSIEGSPKDSQSIPYWAYVLLDDEAPDVATGAWGTRPKDPTLNHLGYLTRTEIVGSMSEPKFAFIVRIE